MQRYLIIIERTAIGYSAHSPDLPGCVATAPTRGDVEQVMRDAIECHLAGLRAGGEPIPPPSTLASWVDVAAKPTQRHPVILSAAKDLLYT
jgi:predicted RNase H-like HicB family nuclease